MTQKRLKITFKNTQDQTKTLEWTVREHPVADKWVTLLGKFKTTSEFSGHNDWWNIGYTQEHLDKYFKKLRDEIAQSTELTVPASWLETLSAENLTNLHSYFHQVAKEKTSNDEDTDSVDYLNFLVYAIETTLNNIKYNQKSGIGVLGFNIGYQVELTPEDRSYFDSYASLPGSIRAGYNTIGKNLYSCFLSQDFATLDQKLVSPQMTLGAEGFLNLSSTSTTNPNSFYAWCDSNNIKEKYGLDCRDPVHSPGKCILADPVDWNEWDLMEWVLGSDRVWVEHWEVV